MKVFIQPKRIMVSGKAWQVQYLLKKYMQEYETVQDWIDGRPKQK
ncbi:hypothetical protein A374_00824 [Fictibacillus macauensis ZFHKF-1]|uniref:Z-ring formation inhibitor MciZ n=1 Tax=Fictibacillus macauensis ZFHKF-1 TaxID=1196324 RepID=I8ANB6_9BACL|nr:Z-ring formation inhibitor MciZ [Fictibacillus macauensis]EIT87279.1 hypothetical protein A374_00824 [Fictibacillus macauensis ZFHKF-1]